MTPELFEAQMNRVSGYHRINDAYKTDIYAKFQHVEDTTFASVVDLVLSRKSGYKPRLADWADALRMARGENRDPDRKCDACGGFAFNMIWARLPDGGEGEAARPCKVCHPLRHAELKSDWVSIPRPEGMMPCGCMEKTGLPYGRERHQSVEIAVETIPSEPEYFD